MEEINSDQTDFKEPRKNKKPIVKRGRFNVDIRKIITGDELEVVINGKLSRFKTKNVNRRKNRISFSAFGQKKGDFLTIAENNGNVVGSIQMSGKLYKVRPGEGNTTDIIAVPSSTLIDHDINYYEDFPVDVDERPSNVDLSLGSLDPAEKFTVIVAYTSNFESDAGDVVAYMDLLEEETNVSFLNSNVNTSVEIVHSYKTSYEGSGDFDVDRDFFSNSANPETSELLRLRETYKADIMMVLTGNSGYFYCGVAREIGATESTALALAREGCAAGYFSFAHEIGHLFGARHIITRDPSMEPFSYGHGYCNSTPSTWRTVMAYGCPSNTGGPRIQQWSNPGVFINGETTGSINVEDNARVLNERALEIANFRVSEASE
ncbi:M12 family metallo-peptidase [Microbulbifer epialgicus]|uniref:M12 family metallo-peptidase n=1 Tax=Microbulbifer epialgicus TaxID=393907 RepID=A0ABV4P7W4_9GAMM